MRDVTVGTGATGGPPSWLAVPLATRSGRIEVLADPALVPPGLARAVDARWAERQGLTAAVGQALVVRDLAGIDGRAALGTNLVLVGLGPADALRTPEGVDALRTAAAAASRQVGTSESMAMVLPAHTGHGTAEVAQALAEGVALGSYRFDAFRSAAAPVAGPCELLVHGAEAVRHARAGAERGRSVAAAVAFARDLVNTPAGSMSPTTVAERARELLEGTPGVTLEIWDEKRLARERAGAILGVAAGSTQPPRLLRAHYRPRRGGVPHLALVGKGITFDSGGLSLKTAGGMETMKTDMAGGAAVLAAFGHLAAARVPVELTAVVPLTENMPSGSATKPGDVLVTRSGRTIEVLNTDAEGRLVLADALTIAAEAEPDAIVDLATLTGAVSIALGGEIAAVLGNDDELMDRVERAARATGERVWELPIPASYRSHIDSDVADMKNTGRAGQAGTIAGALLLQEFVGEVPWVHCDIAGVARSAESGGIITKGGTGWGVRMLVALASSLAV